MSESDRRIRQRESDRAATDIMRQSPVGWPDKGTAAEWRELCAFIEIELDSISWSKKQRDRVFDLRKEIVTRRNRILGYQEPTG